MSLFLLFWGFVFVLGFCCVSFFEAFEVFLFGFVCSSLGLVFLIVHLSEFEGLAVDKSVSVVNYCE